MARGKITLEIRTDKDGDDFPEFELKASWNDVPEEDFGMIERGIVEAVAEKSKEWEAMNLERKRAGK